MARESIQVSAVLPASPQRIFEAWMSSDEHSRFTGGLAVVEPEIGGRHTSWDGYISGTTLALDPGRRILQSWRSSDFPDGSPDSKLEVMLEPEAAGTRITLSHSEIPEGQGKMYEQGWVDHYFKPMAAYFAEGGPSDEDDMGNDELEHEDDLMGDDDLDEGIEDEGPEIEAPSAGGEPMLDDEDIVPAQAPPVPAPAKAPPKPKAPPAKKAPAAKKKAPAAKKKAPAAKKKAPAAKKKAPAKKKKPAAKKKAPVAKKKPAKKKSPAKKKAPAKKKKSAKKKK